jgi:hypothetical protein
MASMVRLPLVGSRLFEWHDQKKDLTEAGLLMEVARNPTRAALQLPRMLFQGC